MKTVKLKSLEIRNFKGIKEFTFNPRGESVEVYGENGTNKTSLFDSFCWLTFGTDSKDQSQFDIKPRDENGDVIHKRDVSIEGTFNVDGEEKTFKRVKREVWKNPRGSTDKVMDGHKTKYLVDGIEGKKKEYVKAIEEILDQEKLHIISDARYFNEQLKWKERREILMGLIDDMSNQEIIEKYGLEDLDLDGKEPSKRRKQLKSKQKDIDEQLDEIPVRIDEISRSEPDIDKSIPELEDEIRELKEKKESLENEIADLKSGGQESQLREKKSKLESEISQFEQEWKDNIRDQMYKIKNQIKEKKDKKDTLEREMQRKIKKRDRKKERIRELEDEIEALRDEWNNWKVKEFDPDGAICPACGQKLPEGDIKEQEKRFKEKRAKRLDHFNQEGKGKSETVDELEEDIENLNGKVDELKETLSEINSNIDKLGQNLKEKKSELGGYDEAEEYKDLQSQLGEVEEKLENVDENPSEVLESKQNELEKVETRLDKAEGRLNELEAYSHTEQRIEELKSKEQDLAGRYEEIQEQLDLLSEFVRKRVETVENKINDRFDLVEFKLFEPLVTKDELKPTCQALVNGVSYNSTLNNGAKIRAGLDIIDTLSEEWEVKAPVFLDNKESITELPEYDYQMVSLIVKKGVEKLEVK